VRYWDADDGWRVGVLCVHCGLDAAECGPKPDDYAVVVKRGTDTGILAAMVAANGDDLDAAYTDCEDAR